MDFSLKYMEIKQEELEITMINCLQGECWENISISWPKVGIIGRVTSFFEHPSKENYKVKSLHILHFLPIILNDANEGVWRQRPLVLAYLRLHTCILIGWKSAWYPNLIGSKITYFQWIKNNSRRSLLNSQDRWGLKLFK